MRLGAVETTEAGFPSAHTFITHIFHIIIYAQPPQSGLYRIQLAAPVISRESLYPVLFSS